MPLGARAARAARGLSLLRTQAAFDPALLCHVKQLEYVASRAKRKVVRCSRRAGKTTGVGISLLQEAKREPYADQYYVSVSLKNARRQVWPTLRKLNKQYVLGGEVNEVEGYMRFPQLPNCPHIFLGGAKDANEVEKLRGYEGGCKRAIIDEAQSIRRSLLKTLVDDVLEPALIDYDGVLEAIGTPGAVRAGYFYDIDEGAQRGAWDHFSWTMLDNTFLSKKSGKPTTQLLKELRERRGWSEDHPTYLREYRGLWVTDNDARVIKYNAERNHYDEPPFPLEHFVIGVDIGYDDACAIVVLGWSSKSPNLYLVDEFRKHKMLPSELAAEIIKRRDKYRPRRIVADTGGLGKMIVADMCNRYAIQIEAAEKSQKLAHYAVVNDALETQTFYAKKSSLFAEDAEVWQWDADKRAVGDYEESSDFHSDVIPAAVYAFRAATHFRFEKPPEPKSIDELDRLREAEEMRQSVKLGSMDWWEASSDEMGFR